VPPFDSGKHILYSQNTEASTAGEARSNISKNFMHNHITPPALKVEEK